MACRELQRKYASDSSGVASVKRQLRSGLGAASDSGLFSRYCSDGLTSETPGAVGRSLTPSHVSHINQVL